jgi:two-component system, OmpR family, alkaline phosphatase synthesis response regulator PhoP
MNKRILLCDDEIHILRAMEFVLKRTGYEIEIASDGQEAWEAIQMRKPDLLIVDCVMPRLTGIELIRRLRDNPQFADIPVIMISIKGYELTADKIQNELNISRIIPKPFSPNELLQDVNMLLEGTAQQV